MNEELREKVHKGIAFLDEKIPDWLNNVGDLETLNINSYTQCVLSRAIQSNWGVARTKFGLSDADSKALGFSANNYDIEEGVLTSIWREEIRLRLDEGGEEPEYPWLWRSYPARIVEENIRGVVGDRVLILYLYRDVETSIITPRERLCYNHGIQLKIGTQFTYDGSPRMVVALPNKEAILINTENGGYCDPQVSFTDANLDTFTPEDFNLDPEKIDNVY